VRCPQLGRKRVGLGREKTKGKRGKKNGLARGETPPPENNTNAFKKRGGILSHKKETTKGKHPPPVEEKENPKPAPSPREFLKMGKD